MSQSLISPIWSRASGHATVYRLAQRASGAVRGHSPAYRAAKRPGPVVIVPLGSIATSILKPITE